jgi:hypothetical protein
MNNRILLTNLTSQPVSFEAVVLKQQGVSTPIRANVPAAGSVTVTLPDGVTAEMLNGSAGVVALCGGVSPKLGIASLPSTDSPSGLANFETFKILTVGAAADLASTILGSASRAGRLGKLRLGTSAAGALTETYEVTGIKVGGVAVSVPVGSLKIDNTALAKMSVEFDLVKILGNVPVLMGAFIEVTGDSVNGTSMADILIELSVERG